MLEDIVVLRPSTFRGLRTILAHRPVARGDATVFCPVAGANQSVLREYDSFIRTIGRSTAEVGATNWCATAQLLLLPELDVHFWEKDVAAIRSLPAADGTVWLRDESHCLSHFKE